jgi:hypothetical protein
MVRLHHVLCPCHLLMSLWPSVLRGNSMPCILNHPKWGLAREPNNDRMTHNLPWFDPMERHLAEDKGDTWPNQLVTHVKVYLTHKVCESHESG